jgi:hypothetical protein
VALLPIASLWRRRRSVPSAGAEVRGQRSNGEKGIRSWSGN